MVAYIQTVESDASMRIVFPVKLQYTSLELFHRLLLLCFAAYLLLTPLAIFPKLVATVFFEKNTPAQVDQSDINHSDWEESLELGNASEPEEESSEENTSLEEMTWFSESGMELFLGKTDPSLSHPGPDCLFGIHAAEIPLPPPEA